MKKIILDTNFLMIPYQFKVDIFEEFKRIIDDTFELYVLNATIDELNDIILEQTGKNREAAIFTRDMIFKLNVKVIDTDEPYVDKAIIGMQDYSVATQDRELREKIKAQGREVFILRQKKYLDTV